MSTSNVGKSPKQQFWKKTVANVPGSLRPVYGAQHPPINYNPSPKSLNGSQPTTPKKGQISKVRDSFQDFQAQTEDAWDDGDDDFISMANLKMSMKDVHSSAAQVINDHSQAQQRALFERQFSSSSVNGIEINDVAFSEATVAPIQSAYGPGKLGPGIGVRLHTSWHSNNDFSRAKPPVSERDNAKSEKYKQILASANIDLEGLRNLAWSGVLKKFRPNVWKILAGYIPTIADRRDLTLQRKRQEYFKFIEHYYATRKQEFHADTFRQISIDIPRMSPLIPLFQQKLVQEIFERILYIWAIRHPASGYVQGINDLVTPFFVVFLSEYIPEDADMDKYDVSLLPTEEVKIIEADSFWCFSKLMDNIQDNYTFAQPGIQYKVAALKDIISRVNYNLHKHLEDQNVEYLQFSFRWMNNLLMREIPLRCTIRLWDSYLSERSDFASLHLYVCAALLLKYGDDLLREKDFQGLMLMLQSLPTHNWNDDDISLLLAEAFRLQFTYADAPSHLQQNR